MNGRSHLVIGAASPLCAASGGASLQQCLVLSIIAAGFSLGPDIDHPDATATKALGQPVHQAAHKLSALARRVVATSSDDQAAAWCASRGRDPYHRGLTHTGIMAVVVGAVATAVALLPWGAGALAGLSLVLATRVWPGKRRIQRLAVITVGIVLALITPMSPVLAGFAAGAGWLSHIIADGCTTMGVPLLWPLVIRGKQWYRVRLLGSLLPSGSPHEWLAVGALTALLALPLISV